MSITLGIDISKDKFDVCILKEDGSLRTQAFKNTGSGFKKLGYLIKKENIVYAGLESTGVYGENLCQFLYDKGYKVFLLNPSQTHYYAKCMMKRTKTDQCDSKNIAQFIDLHKDELNLWKPKPQDSKIVQKLFKCVSNLKEDRLRVLGRIEASSFGSENKRDSDLKIYLKQQKWIEKQIEEVIEQIEKLIQNSEYLKKKYDLLQSIPYVGRITSLGLIAHLPDLENFKCAKKIVAYAGLNPAIRESGSSVKKKSTISKTGNKELRKILYMSSLSLKNKEKSFKSFVERLTEKGKKPKVIVVAVMHKLLRIIFGVLKKGIPFNPEMIA